jgi:hypothetical protein
MEIKILDCILHGQLKPWKFNTANKRRLVEIIKSAKADANILTRLQSLLQDFPALQKLTAEEESPSNLQTLYFQPQLPAFKDPETQFYFLLITAEAQRIFDVMLHRSTDWKEPVDIIYHVSKTLNNIKILAVQSAEELIERSLTTIPDEQSDLNHFALYYLKHSLIALYFSIQEAFKENLQQTTSLDDFYLLDIQEPLSNLLPLKYVGPVSEVEQKDEYQDTQETVFFGFKEDIEKFKTVINQLSFQVDLINQDISTVDELIKLLTTRSFIPGAVQIRLGCETKVFRYVVDKLKPAFKAFTLANIERSKAFLSKQEGTPITANNLSVSGSKSAVEPKDKATIDKIFKHLQ